MTADLLAAAMFRAFNDEEDRLHREHHDEPSRDEWANLASFDQSCWLACARAVLLLLTKETP
jgi:diphthamide synthase subunit DPH2